MKDTWLWWSSGKDSAWALDTLRTGGEFNITGLVTTVNTEFDRVAMHAVRSELLRAQTRVVGLELFEVNIPYPCSNSAYEVAANEAVSAAQSAGVTHMAFGDLYLEDVRAYREQLLSTSEITPVFPLWGHDTRALAQEMVGAGIRAYVTCVDPKVLDRTFAGRTFDDALLADLPPTVDPCGERGEFHTFVFDGPMFSSALDVEVGERVERDGFVFADVRFAA